MTAFDPAVRSFYDGTPKCIREKCHNYSNGRCNIIDSGVHHVCIKELYDKDQIMIKANENLTNMLGELLTHMESLETTFSTSLATISDHLTDKISSKLYTEFK